MSSVIKVPTFVAIQANVALEHLEANRPEKCQEVFNQMVQDLGGSAAIARHLRFEMQAIYCYLLLVAGRKSND